MRTLCEHKLEAEFANEEDLANLVFWDLSDHVSPYDVIVPQLMDRMRRDSGAPFSLIVFDPLYKMYRENQDENAVSDSAMLLNAIGRVRKVHGAAVAYAMHYSKGNQASKNSIDRI